MTKTTKFNISRPTKYTDKNGEEKTRWDNVGYLTVFQKEDGSVSRLIEIPAIGLEARAFPIEEKKAPVESDSPF
jgi:hypothetical protein